MTAAGAAGGGGGAPARSAEGVFTVVDGAGSADGTGSADPADGAAPAGGVTADSDAGPAAGPAGAGADGLAQVDATPAGAAAVVMCLAVGTGVLEGIGLWTAPLGNAILLSARHGCLSELVCRPSSLPRRGRRPGRI